MRNIESLNEVLFVLKDFADDADAVAHAVERHIRDAVVEDRQALHRLGVICRDATTTIKAELAKLPAARAVYRQT